MGERVRNGCASPYGCRCGPECRRAATNDHQRPAAVRHIAVHAACLEVTQPEERRVAHCHYGKVVPHMISLSTGGSREPGSLTQTTRKENR